MDIGDGAHTPESAMSLAEELAMLRKRVKDQDKEICSLFILSAMENMSRGARSVSYTHLLILK